MPVHKWYAFSASLLSAFLLSGATSALAADSGLLRGTLKGPVDVNLGLPKIDVGPILSPLPPLRDPIKIDVTVPSVRGLTPPVSVRLDTTGPIEAGVNVGGLGGPGAGTSPVPETSGAPQPAQRRLDLLPTCL